jgi:hypothetical protein
MSESHSTLRVEYREIPGLDGYRFGSDASAWCNVRRDRYHRSKGEWKLLKPSLGKRGYYVVWITDTNRRRSAYLHTLICTAFHGPCPADMECRHKDGDPRNCLPNNLEWGSHYQNMVDRSRHDRVRKGEAHKDAKLTEAKVRVVRWMHAGGLGVTDIARFFGVYHYTITAVVKRTTWRHVN